MMKIEYKISVELAKSEYYDTIRYREIRIIPLLSFEKIQYRKGRESNFA